MMIYLLIALQLADIITTHYALRTGIGTEANPVLRKLFDRFGHESVLIAIKGAFIALLVWLEQYLTNDIMLVLCLFYVAVVGNNVRIILKGRK